MNFSGNNFENFCKDNLSPIKSPENQANNLDFYLNINAPPINPKFDI